MHASNPFTQVKYLVFIIIFGMVFMINAMDVGIITGGDSASIRDADAAIHGADAAICGGRVGDCGDVLACLCVSHTRNF